MKTFLRVVSFLVIACFIVLGTIYLPTGCTVGWRSIDGRVLDSVTREPIHDAIVLARWQGQISSFVDAHSTCYHALSTTTDERGQFHFPSWHKEARGYRIHNQNVDITVYKPGYRQDIDKVLREHSYRQHRYYLVRDESDREERLKTIGGVGVSVNCGSAGGSEKNLLPLHQALYEEARALAVTKQDRFIVNGLLREVDLIELPYEEAERRSRERNKALRKEFPNG